MDHAFLPFLLVASPAIRKALGPELKAVAVLAMRALLRNRRGLEVALQQIDYRRLPIAFSSRIGRMGDLILELDLGDPALADRLFLEDELKRAKAATVAGRPRR